MAAGEAEIEQDRRRNDRHFRRTDRKAAARLGEPIHDPGGSIEPKGRASGQHNGVDALNQGTGSEQFGFAAARRATADIDRGHSGSLGEHDGRAADSGSVFGLPDQNSRHVGD